MAYIISRNVRLWKIFHFRKELKIIKRQSKRVKKFEQQDGTLIGNAGRKPVYLPDDCKHCFVCGTTGSGKTVTLSNFIGRGIEKNYPMLIIDGKGDTGKGSILDIIKKLNKGGKKLYVINLTSPKYSDTYNPFRDTPASVAKDMLIQMSDWTEEHYKVNAERYLQRILQLFDLGNIPYSFRRIVKAMNVDKFSELSAMLMKKGHISKEDHEENLEIAKVSGKIAQGSSARFSTIAESELGNIFSDDGIDIATALEENAIILFVLNPLVFPEISPAFGRLAIIDAKKAVGRLFGEQIDRTFFILDEINSYASPSLVDLVNKSRSANITCTLATQSLSDLDFIAGEAFKEQIIENCNNYIVMRQNSGVNAEHWANILGTKPTLEVTYQLQQKGLQTSETGYGSARRVREYLYHPDDIKDLQTGEGVYLSRDYQKNSKLLMNKPF